MSGIGGVIHRDGRAIDAAELTRIHDLVQHRGPDGGRIWIDGCAGLSHQHTRTTPESREQPFVDPAAGLAITFDGRLDNRDELTESLEAPTLREADDAEIVLRAYEKWRESCAERLLGDFAFAVFDSRARRVYCARDVMGIRPFYYATLGWVFLFGSELRQILASGRVNTDVDEGTLAEYLADAVTTRSATLYRYVRRLPAAHWMTIDADRLVIKRYWSLDPSRKLHYGDDREYVEHFRSLFKEAVACRMRSAQRAVGAWLSGGVDSSSVVAMTRALAVERALPAVETFSMAFPGDPEADERTYINDVVVQSGLPWHSRPATLPEASVFQDQASAYRDVPALPAEHLAAALRDDIRDRGIRVVLTGAGGDQGFSGSLYHYADLLRRGSLVQLFRQIAADMRVSDVGWKPSRIVTMGVLPLLPRRFKNAVRPLARRLGWPGNVPRWIPPAFAARVGLEARVRGEAPDADAVSDGWVCSAFEHGGLALMLEIAERSAASHGVEERHPFFDRRLIEFALAIPEAQRWSGTQTKVVVREAMRDELPASVYHRRDKADFSAQVIRALEILGGAAFFSQLAIAACGWIDADHVAWMYRDMMSRFCAADETFTRHMFPLWMIAGAELWYRTSVEAAAPVAHLARA